MQAVMEAEKDVSHTYPHEKYADILSKEAKTDNIDPVITTIAIDVIETQAKEPKTFLQYIYDRVSSTECTKTPSSGHKLSTKSVCLNYILNLLKSPKCEIVCPYDGSRKQSYIATNVRMIMYPVQ